MGEVKAAAAPRRLVRGLSRLAAWSDADKCILIVLLTLPFVVAWTLRLLLARADGGMAPYLDRAFLPWMLLYEAVLGGGLLLLGGVALVLRRNPRPRPWLMHLTLQFWYVSQALSLYAIGPYTSPFALICLMCTALYLTVHEVRPIFFGLLTFAALLVASTVLERLGRVPYAPLLVDSGVRPATGWMLSIGGSSLLASGLLLFIFAQVVADWRERERELHALSTTDELTRVANRRHLMGALTLHFGALRRNGVPLSVLLVDVDHFKRINDVHGHLVGDKVLVEVADALRQQECEGLVVAHLGGEEFALLLPGADAERARDIAERCRERVAGLRCLLEGACVQVTVSLGVASAPHPQVERGEQLLRIADEALYRAKAEGRNRVQLAA